MSPGKVFQRVVDHVRHGTLLAATTRRLRWMLRGRAQRYLDRAKGVVHIGANTGQERDMYALCDLPVVWIEPIPEVFATLQRNIAPYSDQVAVQALVTDQDGQECRLNIASNGGGSSSILEFAQHRDIWPGVTFERSIMMRSVTLPSVFATQHLDPGAYDLLVLDTQGSELMVLRGAISMLGGFNQILAEAADFNAYAGGCKLEDIVAFLRAHGFRETARQCFARHPVGGGYFNVLFERTA